MTHSTRITITLALTAVLTGCGGANDYSPKAGMAAADIFAEACQSCHGEGGSGKLGFLLKIAGSDEPAAEIARHIAEGGPVMPAFPNIAEGERLALAEYLKGRR